MFFLYILKSSAANYRMLEGFNTNMLPDLYLKEILIDPFADVFRRICSRRLLTFATIVHLFKNCIFIRREMLLTCFQSLLLQICPMTERFKPKEKRNLKYHQSRPNMMSVMFSWLTLHGMCMKRCKKYQIAHNTDIHCLGVIFGSFTMGSFNITHLTHL